MLNTNKVIICTFIVNASSFSPTPIWRIVVLDPKTLHQLAAAAASVGA